MGGRAEWGWGGRGAGKVSAAIFGGGGGAKFGCTLKGPYGNTAL